MKLSRLNLQGFKSFGQPTQFNFDDGVTAIVGPNGCGKSNVVDAFKWVLGDRSAKSMRGEEMLDVIFNGSNGTPSADYAEVALTFANNTRALPIDYDEVTVCRRLYRSGESEYLLNSQTCRLKDIRELFMNTGVGMESYSIIEQGKVDFILRSNCRERRYLFEEAAGISKYKAKRRETEANLDRAGQDLLRLSDVTREIKREIRSTKILATKAEKYKSARELFVQKKNLLNLYNYHQWQSARNEIAGQISGLAASRQEITDKLAALELAIINLDKELIILDNNLQKNQEQLISLGADIATARNRIESAVTRRAELANEEEQTKQSLAVNTEKAIAARSKLCDMMHQLESSKNELETISQNLSEKISAFAQFSAELKQANQNLEAKKNEIINNTQKQLQYQNDLVNLQNDLKRLDGERLRLANRKKEIADEQAVIALTQSKLRADSEAINQGIQSVKSEISQQELVINSLRDDLVQLQGQVSAKNSELQRGLSRQELLLDLERHHEGLSGGARSVLDQLSAQPGSLGAVYGIVADLIDVKEQYLVAVESALKELSQAIVVRSLDDAFKVIRFVKDNQHGYVTVITLDEIINPDCAVSPVEESLNQLLVLRSPPATSEGEVGHSNSLAMINPVANSPLTADDFSRLQHCLLGQYRLADDITGTRELSKTTGQSILTLAGDIARPNGVITAGGGNNSGIGLISRKTELRHLSEQIPQVQESLKLLIEQQTAKTGEVSRLEQFLSGLKMKVYEQTVALDERSKEAVELNRKLDILVKEAEINAMESQDIESQVNAVAERATATAEVIRELQTLIANNNAEAEQLNQTIRQLAEKAKTLDAEVTELKITQAKTNEKKEFCAQAVDQLTADINQLEQMLGAIAGNLTEIKNKIIGLGESIKAEEATLQAKESARTATLQAIQNLTEQQTGFKQKLLEKKSAEQELQRNMQDINNRYNELSFNEREYGIKLEHLAEKAREETATDIKTVYDQADEAARTAFSAVAPDELTRQIEELRANLGTMNDVNISSIDQLKSLEERLAFLTQQEQDLVKSKHDLQELIRKINRECREKFQSTFDRIQENFNTIFRKLFGGGKAELVLVYDAEDAPSMVAEGSLPANAEQPLPAAPAETLASEHSHLNTHKDILEAGIDIIAKPPGKEPSSISLLSGGEKAMTALSLVMAIFKLHPSPFCILDEADSPLDESNTDRFAGLIKDFAATSQFIVITHNKKTMIAADILYGVTMQTPGVSKKVSVKMIDEIKAIYAEPLAPAQLASPANSN